MNKSMVVVQYSASPEQAFEAALSAVKACGYHIVSQDRDNGVIRLVRTSTYRLGGIGIIGKLISFVDLFGRDLDFAVEILISKLSGEEVEITACPGNSAGAGEAREIAAQFFHRLNEVLGEGKLMQGSLEKPGVVNELKKVLLVLGVFAVMLLGVILVVFLR